MRVGYRGVVSRRTGSRGTSSFFAFSTGNTSFAQGRSEDKEPPFLTTSSTTDLPADTVAPKVVNTPSPNHVVPTSRPNAASAAKSFRANLYPLTPRRAPSATNPNNRTEVGSGHTEWAKGNRIRRGRPYSVSYNSLQARVQGRDFVLFTGKHRATHLRSRPLFPREGNVNKQRFQGPNSTTNGWYDRPDSDPLHLSHSGYSTSGGTPLRVQHPFLPRPFVHPRTFRPRGAGQRTSGTVIRFQGRTPRRGDIPPPLSGNQLAIL